MIYFYEWFADVLVGGFDLPVALSGLIHNARYLRNCHSALHALENWKGVFTADIDQVLSLCVCAGVAVLYVDSWGRRPLLLGGVTGMVAALICLGLVSLQLHGDTAAWANVIALLVYVGAYQVSFLTLMSISWDCVKLAGVHGKSM